MAEAAELIQAIERSGVRLIGPSSHVANNVDATMRPDLREERQ